MKLKDLLRKIGLFRSGTISATYNSGVERPIELQDSGVFNAKTDLLHASDFSKKKRRVRAKKRQSKIRT